MPPMQFEYSQNLPRETLELLKKLSFGVERDSSGTDEVLLAAYVCGISTPEQEETTLTNLVHSRPQRERLLELEKQLEEMRETNFSLIGTNGFSPMLIHCMRGTMQSSMRSLCRSRLVCLARGWSEISAGTDIEAKSIRSIVGAIGRVLQIELGTNRPSGLVNRRASPYMDSAIPQAGKASIQALITSAGSLVVNGAFDPTFAEWTRQIGSNIYLELIDPNGGSIPIGGPITSASWSLTFEGFAEISGLECGPLPATAFRVARENAPPFRLGGNHLYASILGTKESVPLSLVTEPKVEKESLNVILTSPSSLPLDMDHRLELFVPVGNVMQLIGTFPPTVWIGKERVLRCSVAGVVDGQVECGSVVRARLVKESAA